MTSKTILSAVILFIVMMVLGYFYVRALTKGDDSRAAK